MSEEMTTDSNTPEGATEDHLVHHEASDIDVRGVFFFCAGLLITAVAIHVVIWLMFVYFERREALAGPPVPMAAGDDRVPAPPRLQESPRVDLQEFLAREAELLDGYHWIDRDAGVVRIPIAEAMRLTIERGLPVYEGPGEPASQEPVQ